MKAQIVFEKLASTRLAREGLKMPLWQRFRSNQLDQLKEQAATALASGKAAAKDLSIARQEVDVARIFEGSSLARSASKDAHRKMNDFAQKQIYGKRAKKELNYLLNNFK